MSRGKEIETAPSRLGLARVSVVRGEGPQADVACIDDYIKATEAVTDYLTQFRSLLSPIGGCLGRTGFQIQSYFCTVQSWHSASVKSID